MVQGQSTHLPFKINMSGVIPPIFASSILMFPATIAQFFGQSTGDPSFTQRMLLTIVLEERLKHILNKVELK